MDTVKPYLFRGVSAVFISRYCKGTWSHPECVTKPMQHPADLLTLKNGQILMTFSDRNAECQKILARLSSDKGHTWSPDIQIHRTFKNCDFGYPSTVEFGDEELVTVFYARPVKDPYFYLGNQDFYEILYSAGYYSRYLLNDIQDYANTGGYSEE